MRSDLLKAIRDGEFSQIIFISVPIIRVMNKVVRNYVSQLSNLWWMPSSVYIGFGPVMKTGLSLVFIKDWRHNWFYSPSINTAPRLLLFSSLVQCDEVARTYTMLHASLSYFEKWQHGRKEKRKRGFRACVNCLLLFRRNKNQLWIRAAQNWVDIDKKTKK